MTTFPLDALRELFRHMEWADATVWRAVLAHPPAARDARLRELLVHLHGVQRAFLQMWIGQPVLPPPAERFPDVAGIQMWASAYYPELVAWLDQIDAADLSRIIEMPWLREYEEHLGRRFDRPTLAETMFQVTSHTTYHRGQVNVRLREIGGEPPLVDYIAWVWFGRPAAPADPAA